MSWAIFTAILLGIGAIYLIYIAFTAWQHRPNSGATMSTVLVLAMAEWALTYALELGSGSIQSKIIWNNLQFLGVAAVPIAWLGLTLQYSGYDNRIPLRYILLLAIEPFVILILLSTNNYHHFIWKHIGMNDNGVFKLLTQIPGPGFWIHTGYSYLLFFCGAILMIRLLIRPTSLYRKQAFVLLITMMMPWCVNIFSFFSGSSFVNINITPLVFIFIAPITARFLFRYQYLNVVPVAYNSIVESMSDGVLVVDIFYRIIAINQAASQIFELNDVKVIGQPITAIITSWNSLLDKKSGVPRTDGEIIVGKAGKQRSYNLRVSPLKDRKGRLTGELVVIRDITELMKARELKNELTVLQGVMNKIIQAMALIVEMKDPYTAGHERRVARLAKEIATEMGLEYERVEIIQIAAMIHDIGKMNVPAEILSKPGQLNGIEYSLVKTHPQAAFEILKTVDLPWPIADIILQHHEKIDGSGYPAGLSGDDILLEAKIIAVADMVEAMTSHRPHRPSLSMDEVMQEILVQKGILYDSEVVNACVRVLKRGIELGDL